MAMSRFGEVLRQHRLRRGLTQEELAERSHLSARAISDLERGTKARPRLSTLRLLTDALGMDAAAAAALAQAADPARPNTIDASFQGMPALRIQRSELIGRDDDLDRIEAAFLDPQVQMLTLTGLGGVGKTRLAAAVADRLAHYFAGGVVVVSLVGLDDAKLVIPTLARALGVREEAGASPLQSLARLVGDGPRAILLDNCEQVITAAADIAALLAQCPCLKILATSRLPWRTYGERVIEVRPLSFPNTVPDDIESLVQWPSVALLVERAREVQSEFHITPTTAAPVAEICRRLGGVPLAIELAAARLKYLPPPVLLDRLQQQALDVLVAGPRDQHPRHRALRDTIAWSYELLEPDAQWLFRHLGAFARSWSLEAAEAVRSHAGRDVDVLNGLAALVDASLVRAEPVRGEARFSMLETIREYALEQLAASNELAGARAGHLSYYVALGERARPHLNGGSEHTVWLQRLALEEDNLRAALRWSIDSCETDQGLRLAAAVGRYWYLEGSPGQGQEWLEAILRLVGEAGQPAVRAPALNIAALLANARGDYATSQVLLEESLALARAVNDRQQIGICLHNLGALATRRGEYAEASRLLQSAAAAYESGGGPRAAITYNFLGNLMGQQRDFAAAEAWYVRSLSVYEQLHDWAGMSSATGRMSFFVAVADDLPRAEVLSARALAYAQRAENPRETAWALLDVAFVRLLREDYPAVRTLCADSLALRSDSLFSRECVAAALQLLAAEAVDTGEPSRAMRLFGAAAVQWQTTNTIFGFWTETISERWEAIARRQLGSSAEPAFNDASMWGIEQAVAYALRAGSGATTQS
jgi:predicted ATPase/DNA-binding XRE family transcriptional regulator